MKLTLGRWPATGLAREEGSERARGGHLATLVKNRAAVVDSYFCRNLTALSMRQALTSLRCRELAAFA
jgi:hypothetical protein